VQGGFLSRPAAAVEGVRSRMAAARSVTAIRSADSRSAMGAGYSEDRVLGAGSETLPLPGTLKQTFCVGRERQ
jgi:hypothetical protein